MRAPRPNSLACAAFAVAAALPCGIMAASVPAESVDPQRVEEKRGELEALRARIDEIRDAIRRDEQARDALVGELRAVEVRIGEISEVMRRSQQELDTLQRQVQEALAERDRAAAALYQQRRDLRAQIRAAYVLGRQERLKLLLRQGEPERVGRVLVYHDYLRAARERRISAFMTRLEALEALEVAIARQWDEIERVQAAHAEELDAQRTALQKRQEVLDQLDQKLTGNQQALQGLERDEAALHNLVKELQTVLRELERARKKEPFANRRGDLGWPVRGEVEVGAGPRRASGNPEAQGLTLLAAAGTPVRAVHGGQVVFADWLKGFGLLLIVDHGDEYLSIYAHTQSLYSRVGDWVATDDVIATVGDSGGQSRPALYFEIRHRGAALDPTPWFASRAPSNDS